MKTKKEVIIRSIIAGAIYLALGLVADYIRYHALRVGSIIGNTLEAILFAVVMCVFMLDYYKRKARKKK